MFESIFTSYKTNEGLNLAIALYIHPPEPKNFEEPYLQSDGRESHTISFFLPSGNAGELLK